MLKQYSRIAKITLILIYLVILAGAIVRMTGSGMGCPDWPKCFGYYTPPTNISQLKWQPNHQYKKGHVIILNETLKVANKNFISASTFNNNNWLLYTKHDYAVFNPLHTWVEYINRLLGALAGLATLFLAIASLRFRKTDKYITFLSFFVLFGMGFQAWLGKTVVDSNLAPLKITIHMLTALAIVAIILYLIFRTRQNKNSNNYNSTLKNVFILAFILGCIQITLGTQVRQFVDEKVKQLGYHNAALWLSNPEIVYYLHRSFSILIIIVTIWLFWFTKKHQLIYKKLYGIGLVLLLAISSGIAMIYFHFPFGTQSLHLVLACALFSLQWYLILEASHAKKP